MVMKLTPVRKFVFEFLVVVFLQDMSIKNVTAQLGVTTYLHCRVNSLGGKTVSYCL